MPEAKIQAFRSLLGLKTSLEPKGLSDRWVAPVTTGVAPHRWLIERAKMFLVEIDLSLAEVSLACGFADQSHFTAVFRKAVGATPGGYRREIRV